MSIEDNGYLADPAQVEQLARDYLSNLDGGNRAAGSYLRILVAGCQVRLNAFKRTPGRKDAERVLEEVTDTYYPAVLRGITTPEVADDPTLPAAESTRRARERNRRTNFARTAKSVLARFIRAGGDVRALVVGELTKASLREFSAQNGTTATPLRAVERYGARLHRQVMKLAKSDPQGATEVILSLVAKLEVIADGIRPPNLLPHRREQQMPRQESIAV